MKVGDALVSMLRMEGITQCFCFPFSPVMEPMSRAGLPSIVTRQERVAGNMADGVSRSTNGRQIGTLTVQGMAGSENAFAGIAHAYTDSVPILFLPGHPGLRYLDTPTIFDSARNYAATVKMSQKLIVPDQLPNYVRRSFTALRSGRPGPVMLEVPSDVCNRDWEGEIDYTPVPRLRSAADQGAVEEAAERLLASDRPLIWVGQGVHFSEAYEALQDVTELLGTPVMTTLQGKSAFPETHPLSAGMGGHTATAMVVEELDACDALLAVGTSLSHAPFTRVVPDNKTIVHATVDPSDINKDYAATTGVIADAKLFLEQLAVELRKRIGDDGLGEKRAATEARLAKTRTAWLAEFEPLFSDDSEPINGYRMFRELWAGLDPDTTMITHEAGASRDIQSVFYQSTTPRSYLGWGQSSQLGFSLGLAMGAKIANPDKTVVNVMGDGSIGMTGMDLETAARNNIGTLTIIKHDSIFSGYDQNIPESIKRFDSATQHGDYAELARALGCHAETVTKPAEIRPALQRALNATGEGQPAVLDVITAETRKLSHKKIPPERKRG